MKKTLTLSMVALAFSSYAGNGVLKSDNNTIGFKPEKKESVLKNKTTEDGERTTLSRQVVKINLFPIALGSYGLQYEYAFHKNFSGALGLGFFKLPQRYIDKAFPPDATGTGAQNIKMNGWSITPEFRFYPGKKIKHQAPHGFYLAPYFRYSSTKISGEFHSDLPDPANPSTTKSTQLDMTVKYSGYSAGLMIGKQWIIGKHFSIDWFILGGGAGKAKLDVTLAQDLVTFDAAQQAELQKQLDEQTADIAIPGFDVTATAKATSNGATLMVKGVPMFSLRSFGLNLGFAF